MSESENAGPEQAKTSEQILAEEVAHGLGELRRQPRGLLISGFSAGLDIGFSVLFIAVVLTLMEPGASPLLQRVLVGNMYAVGFVFVILGRSELFTEHTTLAVFPVLTGDATLRQLVRVWGLVYASNLVGAALFALFAVVLGFRLGVVDAAAFDQLATDVVSHDPLTIFASAVAAGWLMGLLSWLAAAAQETVSRVLIVWLITAGVFGGTSVSLADLVVFLPCATLGNAVGGVALVAIVKYGHATRSR